MSWTLRTSADEKAIVVEETVSKEAFVHVSNTAHDIVSKPHIAKIIKNVQEASPDDEDLPCTAEVEDFFSASVKSASNALLISSWILRKTPRAKNSKTAASVLILCCALRAHALRMIVQCPHWIWSNAPRKTILQQWIFSRYFQPPGW